MQYHKDRYGWKVTVSAEWFIEILYKELLFQQSSSPKPNQTDTNDAVGNIFEKIFDKLPL